MIQVTNNDTNKYGGFLNALNHNSFEYLNAVLKKYWCLNKIENLRELDKVILHIDPHLDEYCASLIFLSSLPYNFRKTAYEEVSLHSEHHNPRLLGLVQNAAIFGIGSVGNLGENALFSFDEHIQGGTRRDPSCTSIVRNVRFNRKLPKSFRTLIHEVDVIDSKGGAYPQSINNIIKGAHDVRLVMRDAADDTFDSHDWLTPFWKWTIMNACLTATIYCLEENIQWTIPRSNELIKKSLAYFTDHSNFSKHPEFHDIRTWLRKHYHGQQPAFLKARLKGSNHVQNLILGKVCISLHECYGPQIAEGIMMHFWEILYHNQRDYLRLNKTFTSLFNLPGHQTNMSSFGYVEKRSIQVRFLPSPSSAIPEYLKLKLWILFIEPLPSVTNINKAFNSLLKQHNQGFGFIYIWNSAKGSVALFKSSAISDRIWRNLKSQLKKREPDLWHDEGFDHFILNGNKTHQYVDRTAIDLEELETIIKRLK